MKILFLTFYFEPDLCAGSFRNSPLAEILAKKLSKKDSVEVFTTMPNRYSSYTKQAPRIEKRGNLTINRIKISSHENGFKDQMISFWSFYRQVKDLVQHHSYDLVFASSSRLFTAYLGFKISKQKGIPLYLDIRDIFSENIREVVHPLARIPLTTVLKYIEQQVFSRANHINLVSGGFEDYFSQYDRPSYSFFTNGIDKEFLELPTTSLSYEKPPFIVTYAGNIGEGQAIHIIIPKVAKILGSEYKFRIIGDGGCREQLVAETEGLNNVEILSPVDRVSLKKFYAETHFLFLHLNSYKAFESVLPSKIFEYAATGKPIFAGVGGYASKFISEYLPEVALFDPNDADVFIQKIRSYGNISIERNGFIKKFKRENIMDHMADSILKSVR